MATRRTMVQGLPILSQNLANPSVSEQLAVEGKKIDWLEVIRMWFEASEWRNVRDVIIDMTPADLQRLQQQSQGGVIQQKAQAQSQLEQQKFEQQQQLLDQGDLGRAARDMLRQQFKSASEPESLTGLPTATTGFGSLV